VSSPPPPDPWPAESSSPEGRFAELDPNDDDTGPLRIPTPPPTVDSSLDSGADDDAWWRRFEEPVAVRPRPTHRNRKPIVLVGAVVLVAVVVAGGLAFWLLRPSPPTPNAGTDPTISAAPTSPSPDADAQEQLLRLLPAGYLSDSCKPVAPPKGALAEVNCAGNIDPGGPQPSTYTLVRDKAALDAPFNDIVRASTRVNCPGNIQSPGPWRRNATPHKTSGVLFCGFQESRPTVAWTNDDDLLVSTIQSGPQGPTFDQLYSWWSSHS
jgi:serine/threonine kinase PknH